MVVCVVQGVGCGWVDGDGMLGVRRGSVREWIGR